MWTIFLPRSVVQLDVNSRVQHPVALFLHPVALFVSCYAPCPLGLVVPFINVGIPHSHTCDTFLNPNREIWNFWSGNLCLVSGGFHVANFGPFLPKLKSRNLVTFLEICYRASQCQHMPTEMRICVRLQFKKPPLILF